MRRFRCWWDESKDRAKSRTELRELRSISMTCSLELGTCSARLSFTFRPLSSVLAGMITFAPLSASTLAVSFPMPFVAPAFFHVKPSGDKKIFTDRSWSCIVVIARFVGYRVTDCKVALLIYSLSSLFSPRATIVVWSKNNIMLQLKLLDGLKTTGETKARLQKTSLLLCAAPWKKEEKKKVKPFVAIAFRCSNLLHFAIRYKLRYARLLCKARWIHTVSEEQSRHNRICPGDQSILWRKLISAQTWSAISCHKTERLWHSGGKKLNYYGRDTTSTKITLRLTIQVRLLVCSHDDIIWVFLQHQQKNGTHNSVPTYDI